MSRFAEPHGQIERHKVFVRGNYLQERKLELLYRPGLTFGAEMGQVRVDETKYKAAVHETETLL